MAGIGAAPGGCVLVVVFVSGLVACSQGSAPRGSDQITPTYNQQTGRLEKITYDRNHDGKVDAWTVMEGTRVVRAELDENFDGHVDRWEHYDTGSGQARAAAPSSGGVLSRVDTSTRDDGKVSRSEHYEKGQRVRAEEDTNGDGRIDRWETWEAGTLVAVTLDTDGDGTADRRMVYPADGSGPRFEVADGSGVFRPAR